MNNRPTLACVLLPIGALLLAGCSTSTARLELKPDSTAVYYLSGPATLDVTNTGDGSLHVERPDADPGSWTDAELGRDGRIVANVSASESIRLRASAIAPATALVRINR